MLCFRAFKQALIIYFDMTVYNDFVDHDGNIIKAYKRKNVSYGQHASSTHHTIISCFQIRTKSDITFFKCNCFALTQKVN